MACPSAHARACAASPTARRAGSSAQLPEPNEAFLEEGLRRRIITVQQPRPRPQVDQDGSTAIFVVQLLEYAQTLRPQGTAGRGGGTCIFTLGVITLVGQIEGEG